MRPIYVYDNNSSDRTIEVARAAGAIVRTERMQGKGNVVRRMFADVDADIYVMADGDATYDAAVRAGAGRVPARGAARHGGRRPCIQADAAYRARPPRWAIALLTGMLAQLFGRSFTDILSGYRVLFAPLREELPGALGGLRDRDRDQRPRARAQDAGRRDRGAAYFARPEGIEVRKLSALSRRLPRSFEDDRACSTGSSGRCCVFGFHHRHGCSQ